MGYASVEKEITFVQVAETIEPVAGNNLENIQKAINRIAERTLEKSKWHSSALKMRTPENKKDFTTT